MIEKIEHALEKYVRPKLAEHYGDVKILSFNDGILEIKLEGQCSNCPSAKFTVEHIIVKGIKEHVQGVEKVVLINGVNDDLLDFAKKILNKEV